MHFTATETRRRLHRLLRVWPAANPHSSLDFGPFLGGSVQEAAKSAGVDTDARGRIGFVRSVCPTSCNSTDCEITEVPVTEWGFTKVCRGVRNALRPGTQSQQNSIRSAVSGDRMNWKVEPGRAYLIESSQRLRPAHRVP